MSIDWLAETTEMYLLIVPESGKSKIKAELIPDEGSLPGLQMTAFLLCRHMVESEGANSGVSSYKDTNSIMRAPPS